jgi:preprotein translocase subunit SecB
MSESQPLFQIEKLYAKDLSLEIPNAPQVFVQQSEPPQIEVQISNESAMFAENLYEVTVTVTVTAKSGERTLFLVEATQAGIFTLRGVPPAEIEPLLGIACPNIVYPYVREAISDLVTRAGFPPVVLAPVAFEAIYAQRQQQAGAAPRIEVAS